MQLYVYMQHIDISFSVRKCYQNIVKRISNSFLQAFLLKLWFRVPGKRFTQKSVEFPIQINNFLAESAGGKL